MAELTAKQRLFVAEYLKDLNATQAAIRAGYSERTAQAMGAENLTKPLIKAQIDAALADREERTQIDADWVLKRLAAEAEADIADLYDEATGALLPVHKWPKIWRQGLVAGVDVYEEKLDGVKIGETVKVKLSDRIKRIELIGRHVRVKAFEDTINVKGLDTLADRMERAAKRDG